jgi:VIT1/CCC1 family predicted Fe2+/Mn2+ transporter
MLIGAIGCNLAWGIVDGIMYILDNLGQRGRDLLTLHRVRGARSPETAHGLLAEALPEPIAAVLRPDEIESIRNRVAALPEPPQKASVEGGDFLGALAIFLVVFLSTFPVVIPFLVMHDAMKALRLSNAIAIAMLFVGGYLLAKSSGYRPWRTGLAMVTVGVVLVAITIALGG